ncbi:PQQ-binding-like beta-propeller repeat protein [Streptomyces sp. HUCO-GS316]|uniref:protein kinase domain-containing protein n=1 Tax=Streptomyces sp. HUCO-GS316 TaxID=2692198 RepID=UPI00136B8CCE|nr:PQQ-binding-like beta-propeller repeat protein [Streptomyces sp. HUCO-GS316]
MPLHRDDPKSVGGYRLVDRLGAGGMGVVYWGRSRSGRDVAVKVVHAQYAEDAVFRTRFRQEIAAVRKVSGAFTAPVVDADPEAARPWMATQYVPGSSLAERLREHGPLRGTALRRLALGLVEALQDIHRAEVVHRDLKPANVLMAEDGPRVIDFGISRAAENHTLTETGQMIGTPPFMSPEQFSDARSVGPASDVFSLGALLVFTTTGRGPFDAESPYLTAYRVIHNEPVLDGLALPLRAVLERCLAKNPADRPGLDELAREFAAALPETAPGDLPTVTLRRDALPSTADTGPGAASGPAATTPPRLRSRIRPLWAATGTVGALALGLTAYLLTGPWPADGGARPDSPRWAALPESWKPFQTTVFETAPLGARDPLFADDDKPSGEPGCLTHEGAVYCAGEGILPVRLDGRTGRTVWRAGLVPSATESASYSSSILGVRDGTVIVRQTVFGEDSLNDPVRLVAVDAGTGAQRWTRKADDENIELALAGDVVLTSDTGGRRVTARAPRTGAARWTAQLPAGHYCTFMAAGTGLYAQCFQNDVEQPGNSVILELDRTDGSVRRLKGPPRSGLLGVLDGRLVVLEWGDRESQSAEDDTYGRILLVDPGTGARSTAKPAQTVEGKATLADGTLWFVTSGGRVTAVSPRTGRRLWQARTSLEQPGEATYDTRTRTLYLASASGRVAALDSRTGTVLWETLPHARRVSSAAVAQPRVLLRQGALIVSTPDGTLFSLDPAHPERKAASG